MSRIPTSKIIIIFAICISSCRTTGGIGPSTSNDSHILVYSPLPISETAEIPKINIAKAIESPDVKLVWTRCKDAVNYELERTNFIGWELAYTGKEVKYDLTNTKMTSPISYRVRAVYFDVVSQWSNIIHYP